LLVSLHVIPSRDAFEGDLTEPGYRKVTVHATPRVALRQCGTKRKEQ
jgi:hypothetical protein